MNTKWKNTPKSSAKAKKPSIFSITIPIFPDSGSARDVITVSAMIPSTSSIRAAPSIALPALVLSFPSSLSVSTVILTDVAVRITPTKTSCRNVDVERVGSAVPNRNAVAAPPTRGTITPIRAIIELASPHFFISRISVSRPATNISTITPISDRLLSIGALSRDTRLRHTGPKIMPATSAPTT